MAPTKTDTKFQDYESSVSDVWDAGVTVDSNLVTSSAAKVIQMHATGNTKNDLVMPNCNPMPSKNSRVRAMQLLAIQRDPVAGGPAMESPSSSPLPASGIYPRLPEAGTSSAQKQNSSPRGQEKPKILETTDSMRFERLKQLLEEDGIIEIEQLRKDCWMGIPHILRPKAWRILSGYVPTHAARREETLAKKRKEYWHFVEQYFHTRYDEQHQETFRQISIDVPRMSPLIPLFQQKRVQEIFERILYIWAVRHPASGYVQGINDLVTPFFVVFLSEYISSDIDVGSFDVAQLHDELYNVEADSFWCVSSLLSTIQDNYTFAQPGIQRKVAALKDLMGRVDVALYKHLENNQVEFLQFAFRWMNNLLMREIPLRATIRLWDTYLSERSGFSEFHTYVCAAFLRLWSKQILAENDFQGILLLLQSLPTQRWTDKHICELTADAYSLMQVFHGARNHLSS